MLTTIVFSGTQLTPMLEARLKVAAQEAYTAHLPIPRPEPEVDLKLETTHALMDDAQARRIQAAEAEKMRNKPSLADIQMQLENQLIRMSTCEHVSVSVESGASIVCCCGARISIISQEKYHSLPTSDVRTRIQTGAFQRHLGRQASRASRVG